MGLNDAVHWSADLGGGTRVALIQAGTFRSDAGALFGPVPRLLWERWAAAEIDHEHRLLQALNCLLIETPAGRVVVETGIGERVSDKVRQMREYEGTPVAPALARAGFDPTSVDVVAMDIKLPSATGRDTWAEHREFLAVAPEKIFVKVVVTDRSTAEELARAAALVREAAPMAPFLLQPATPRAAVRPPDPRRLLDWSRQLRGTLPQAAIVPQWHPLWGLP